MSQNSLPDAEAQCAILADQIRPHLTAETALIGIHSGGAWVAQRLHQLLAMPGEIGLIDVSFYRDDFSEKGLHPQIKPTSIPFDIEDRPLILVDDVLFTGRTTRAAVNELFDYGRPARIALAVLADRGGRQLPVCANFCVWTPELDAGDELILEHGGNGKLQWRCEHHA